MAARISIRSRLRRWSRALFAGLPPVSVINVADVLERIESVVDQITFVVRFLAGFSSLRGLMIWLRHCRHTLPADAARLVVLRRCGPRGCG